MHRGFIFEGDRYRFDFGYCAPFKGWKQYDTTQDAWYFGCWVNIKELSVVTYAEGDVTVKLLDNEESMKKELDRMQECYGDPPPALVALDLENKTVTNVYDTRPTIEVNR